MSAGVGDRGFGGSATGPSASQSERVSAARVYDARRLRDEIFGEHQSLFGEPAWDIMLDLYANTVADRRVYISNACAASAVPPTTGLRYVSALVQSGLVLRESDPVDRRRHWLVLSDTGREKIDRWLEVMNQK